MGGEKGKECRKLQYISNIELHTDWLQKIFWIPIFINTCIEFQKKKLYILFKETTTIVGCMTRLLLPEVTSLSD